MPGVLEAPCRTSCCIAIGFQAVEGILIVHDLCAIAGMVSDSPINRRRQCHGAYCVRAESGELRERADSGLSTNCGALPKTE